MPWLEIVTMVVGLLFALDFGYKLAVQTYREPAVVNRAVFPMLLFLTLATAGLTWLFIG